MLFVRYKFQHIENNNTTPRIHFCITRARLTLIDNTTKWRSVKSLWHKPLSCTIRCLISAFHTCTPGSRNYLALCKDKDQQLEPNALRAISLDSHTPRTAPALVPPGLFYQRPVKSLPFNDTPYECSFGSGGFLGIKEWSSTCTCSTCATCVCVICENDPMCCVGIMFAR